MEEVNSGAGLGSVAYVGPRPFRFGQRLYGRDKETAAVVSLLISRRLVLIHSPSGAGKTSLINAALIPALQKRRFETPMQAAAVAAESQPAVVRLNREPEPDDPPGVNRYLLSALLSLELHRPPDQRRSKAQLAALSLDAYLEEAFPAASREWSDQVTDDQQFRPLLIVFDQFEELVTLDPTDETLKLEFVRQVARALENRGRWALFAIREDFLGTLEPFFPLLPTGLAATYHLDLLRTEAAQVAIRQPARDAGVEFADGVVEHLVDELRQVRVQRHDGVSAVKPGLHVEPVHLQVVCQSLWGVKGDSRQITFDHLKQLGGKTGSGVDDVLAGYYAASVARAASESQLPERTLRSFFSQQLIGANRVRRPVLVADAIAFGLTLEALKLLDRAFLIRREQRSGALWYELAHDRLMGPVLTDNEAWQRANLSTYQIQAALWAERDRPEELLLKPESLAEAEKHAASRSGTLTEVELDFLEACRKARDAAEAVREQRLSRERVRRLQVRVTAGIVLIGILAAAVLVSVSYAVKATRAERRFAWRAYAGQISSAQEYWEEGLVKLAWTALNSTHPDYRGWEYEYLRSLFMRDTITFTGQFAGGPEKEGHSESVTRVLSSDHRQRIFTASEDYFIKVWDAPRRAVMHNLLAHSNSVLCMALSSDQRNLVSACEDSRVVVWTADGLSFRPVQTIDNAHDDAILDVAWFPDSKRFVSAGREGVLKLWSRASTNEAFQLASTFAGHEGWVTAVRVLANGRILSGSSDGTVRLWDPAVSPPMLQVVRTGIGDVAALAVDPVRSAWVVAGGSRGAVIWEISGKLAPDSRITPVNPGRQSVTALAASDDGAYVACGYRDGVAEVFDSSTWMRQLRFQAHSATIRSIAYERGTANFFTAGVDGLVKRWTGAPQEDPVPLQEGFGPVWKIAYSPNPKSHWFATAHGSGVANVWDSNSHRVLRTLAGHTQSIYTIAASADGTRLATGSRDRTARVWDVESGRELLKLGGHEKIVGAVAFSRDGARLFTGSYDEKIRVWKTSNGSLEKSVRAHVGGVYEVSCSPDGRRLASVGEDSYARIWDLETMTELRALPGLTGGAFAVAWSHDGSRLATGGRDKIVRVWDPDTGRELLALKGHSAWVTQVEFAPDGQRLASASQDNSVRMWETRFGQETIALHEHWNTVWSIGFSPTGRTLVSGSEDWTVRVRRAGNAKLD